MKKTLIDVIVCLVGSSILNYVHAQQGQKGTVSEILGGMMGIIFIIEKKRGSL